METVAARLPTPRTAALPDGATDCHAHIFGPLDRFPTGPSTYAIPLAEPSVYTQMLERAGFSRGVLIQPAPYGRNTDALEAALSHLGGRTRGIAVADASISDEQMQRLHRAGVRGLRFIETLDPISKQRYAGSIGVETLTQLVPRMRALGWHAEIWARCADIPRIFDAVAGFGMPIVFDHMGQYDPSEGVDGAAFTAFLEVTRAELAYTKITFCRVSRRAPDYDDLRPFHDALLAAAPTRLIWGSDWPFVRMGDASPDVSHLVDLHCAWAGSPQTIQATLVDNPQRLYGF